MTSQPVHDGGRGRSEAIAVLILLAGAAVRLRVYLANFSLRRDEASLALNLFERSHTGLLRPLDRVQGAPVGFLWLEKFAVSIFGPEEWALRLVPLVAGLAALPLFWVVARRLLGPRSALVALALFAASGPLTHYAAETKQYASDVAIALALLALTPDRSGAEPVRWLALMFAGAASVWFSHPAIFVLGGIGLALVLPRGPCRRAARVVLPVWSASFAAAYFAFLRPLRANEALLDFWSGGFAPLPPRSPSDLKWFLARGLAAMADPAGLPQAGLGLFAFVLGCGAMGDRRRLALLLGPIALALAASGLRAYPFSGRLILFAAPLILLVVARGIAFARQRGGRRIGGALLVLLVLEPTLGAVRTLLLPAPGEELRPVLQAIERRWKPGDALYVYYGAEPPFLYYSRHARPPLLRDASPLFGVSGRDDWRVYPADLARLRGRKRAWVVFSHIVKVNGADEERLLMFLLDRIGRKISVVEGFGASAALYDLSGPEKPAEKAYPPGDSVHRVE